MSLLEWLGLKQPEEDDVRESLDFNDTLTASVTKDADHPVPSFATDAPDAGECVVELRNDAGKLVFLDRFQVDQAAPGGSTRISDVPSTRISVGPTSQEYQEFEIDFARHEDLPFDLPDYLKAKNADRIVVRWSCE